MLDSKVWIGGSSRRPRTSPLGGNWGAVVGTGGVLAALMSAGAAAPVATAAGVHWSIVASPDNEPSAANYLQAASCVSASACASVGSWVTKHGAAETLVESWNGKRWSITPSPPAGPSSRYNYLQGVTCTSPRICRAVGDYGNAAISLDGGTTKTLIESWDGKSWSVLPSPNAGGPVPNGSLAGVSCPSAHDCLAVGNFGSAGAIKTLIESWDGKSWSVLPSPNEGLSSADYLWGVSCAGPSACTAVGDWEVKGGAAGTLVESWDGSAWSLVTSPNGGASGSYNVLNGISCASSSACVAVGRYETSGLVSKTLIEAWDGIAWSVLPSPNEGSFYNTLNGVSCPTASACTAVGSFFNNGGRSKTLVESWDGRSWSVVASPNVGPAPASGAPSFANGLNAVSCNVRCTAVGWSVDVRTSVTKALIESGPRA